MPLPGPLLQRLHEALLAAFPQPGELAQALRFRLSLNLHEITPSNEGLSPIYFRLLLWADSQNRVCEVLDAALLERPDHEALKVARASVCHPSSAGSTQDVFARCVFPNRSLLFWGRDPLRRVLRQCVMTADGRRVLAVSGEVDTGKSYTAEFIRRGVDAGHFNLAFINLRGVPASELSPFHVACKILRRLGVTALAGADATLSHESLLDWMVSLLRTTPSKSWIVLDGLQATGVSEHLRRFVASLSHIVGNDLPHLHLALIECDDLPLLDPDHWACVELTAPPSREDLRACVERAASEMGIPATTAWLDERVAEIMAAFEPRPRPSLRWLHDMILSSLST